MLSLTDHDGQLTAAVKYDESRFTRTTATALLEKFRQVLKQGFANPDVPVSALATAISSFESRPVKLPDDTPIIQLSSGQQRPLFLVHGLGGHITNFIPLSRCLADDRSVFALEAVGLADDRAPHNSISEMAGYYVDAIRDVQPRGPYLLAGWSMGGTVAWDMARQLRSQGESIGLLALLDAHPLWRGSVFERNARVAKRILSRLGTEFSNIASLPKRERWPALLLRAKTLSGTDGTEIRRLIETCEAHMVASSSFVPAAIDVDVLLYWANQRRRKSTSVWQDLCKSAQSETVPGSHDEMLQPPNVQQLSKRLLSHLPHETSSQRRAG